LPDAGQVLREAAYRKNGERNHANAREHTTSRSLADDSLSKTGS
jgi:hypothetical protein